jgi:hypothetical protein
MCTRKRDNEACFRVRLCLAAAPVLSIAKNKNSARSDFTASSQQADRLACVCKILRFGTFMPAAGKGEKAKS